MKLTDYKGTTRWLGLLMLLASTTVSLAQTSTSAEQANSVPAIPTLTGSVEVDGKLDEPQWQQAAKFTLDYITYPFENTTPEVSTEVMIFENDEVLYIGFLAQDNAPEDIRARYADRDDIRADDTVGLRLDTFNSGRLAYEFRANPLGIQYDAVVNELTGSASDNWDATWYSDGVITDTGYQVEISIPLRELQFNESTADRNWGVEFFRIYQRNDRLKISNVPIDRNNTCDLCQLRQLVGVEKISKSKDLAIVPTLVGGRVRERDLYANDGWNYSSNREVGADIIWGVTPELSLQATFNPDFSQVEADAAQLSVNNPFALFYDDKRPFFLENSEYFSSNFDLIYTRNVAAPNFGAKLTGGNQQHTYGVFVAEDASTRFLVPDNLGSDLAFFDDSSINLAGRYRYDVNADFSLGVVATVRDAQDYHNYVYGFDGKYLMSDKDIFKVQVVRSETEYPDALFQQFCGGDCSASEDLSAAALRTQQQGEFAGLAYRIEYEHNHRDWYVYANHQAFTDDFRADLGFESLSDHRRSVVGGGLVWYEENSWWNSLVVFTDWDIAHNDNGEVLEKKLQLSAEMYGIYQSFFSMTLINRERVGLRHDPSTLAIVNNTTLFQETSAAAVFGASVNKDFSFNLSASYGDQIDFANNRLGTETYLEPSFIWNVGKHFKTEAVLTYVAMDVDSKLLFTAKLADWRMSYQFDQQQFLRLILTHAEVDRNQQNYGFDVTENESDIGLQLLYSYEINPLTKVLVGYTDYAFKNDLVQSLTSSEQSVFVKLSYAFRY